MPATVKSSNTKAKGKAAALPPLPKPLQKGKKYTVKQMSMVLNAMSSRMEMMAQLGQQFDGRRELYEIFGYLKDPGFNDFLAIYERDGVGGRVVDAYADETWRKDPIIVDGQKRSDVPDDDSKSEFLIAWQKLVDRLNIYEYMRICDINCGIGRYTLLAMGVKGGGSDTEKALVTRFPMSSVADPDRLLYLQVFDEGQAHKIKKIDRSKRSARYGLPVIYEVDLKPEEKADEDIARIKTVKFKLHHSRVIHIAEKKRRSRVLGTPRLKRIINYIFDLQKVTGSSAEAFFQTVYQGFIVRAAENTTAPKPGDDDYADLENQFEDFVHKMTKYLFVDNADGVDVIKADTSSPEHQFKACISLIAGATGIPQRILIGSERGELSSDQDDKNFADVIQTRQAKFAEKDILRPFIVWCLDHNILPEPESGREGFKIEWPSLFELNDVEKADVAYKVAQAVYVITKNNPTALAAFPVDEFFKKYLGFIPRIGEIPKLPAGTPEPEGGAGAGDSKKKQENPNGSKKPEPVPA